MSIGTVIDTRLERGKDRPEYLFNVRVMSGNARGTHIFRIDNIRYAEPNVHHYSLSSWHADATPISEKTGKDMSGIPGNARLAKSVVLKGSFGNHAKFE